jgi:hypothetical protein
MIESYNDAHKKGVIRHGDVSRLTSQGKQRDENLSFAQLIKKSFRAER